MHLAALCGHLSYVARWLLSQKRKLLTIAHSYVVGLNRRLAHEMSRQGGEQWEVCAVAPRYFHGAHDLRPVHLHSEPADAYRLEPVRAYLTRLPHIFFYGTKLFHLLHEPWDLVHAWQEPFLVVGGQIAHWTPKATPLVFRTAQSAPKNFPPPFGWIERRAMGRAAGWICSGKMVEEVLKNRAGYAGLPHRLIPLGVDPKVFYPDSSAGLAALRKLGWDSPGPPVVGFLGRFLPEKGLRLLLRALEALPTPWRALFVGAGPLENELREWAAPRADLVRICTDVEHAGVPQYLNAMDVLCAPSQTTRGWREQFGRMIIEAWACAVPVLGSDSGEIPNLIQDPQLILSERSAAAWTQKLELLLNDRSLRTHLGQQFLARVHERFTWEAVASAHLQFFAELIEARSSAPRRHPKMAPGSGAAIEG